MFQDVLLFELFQRTFPNPHLFSSKSAQKCLPSHSAGKAIRFFPDVSATNQSAPVMTWKQAQPYNTFIYNFPVHVLLSTTSTLLIYEAISRLKDRHVPLNYIFELFSSLSTKRSISVAHILAKVENFVIL